MKNLSITALALPFVLVSLTGCGKVAPPGKTVLILEADGDTQIINQGVYRPWGRDKLYFVDKKLNSFAEDMNILCADDINMAVDVKATMSFRVDESTIDFIRTKVPSQPSGTGDEVKGQELSIDRFYEMVIRDIVRSSARNAVSKLTTDDIRPNREVLEQQIVADVRRRVKELSYPIDVSAVLISNIEYPETVTRMREAIKSAQLDEQKQAAVDQMRIAQAKRDVAIEQERAKVTIVEAQARADSNKIMSESLTPEFLQWRQMEMTQEMARSVGTGAGSTVYVMPYDAIGPSTSSQLMLQKSLQR